MSKRRVVINDRDLDILRICFRFRCAFIYSLAVLGGYSSDNYAEKRIAKLTRYGYLKKEKIYTRYPNLITVTTKGMALIDSKIKTYDMRTANAFHEAYISVAAAYFKLKYGLNMDDLITERDQFALIGSRGRFRQDKKPDLVIPIWNTCVEVELTPKSRERLSQKIYNNRIYGKQIWVVRDANKALQKQINESRNKYSESKYWDSDVEILTIEEIERTVREFENKQ
ncbi:hypothetical protein [Sinanaerobacter chloroacetimidivorans]|uniref:Uncharacterized protein n=1 Tax=Sinanaerobacter chloroacetimidivorans TaxID=2818044 RepID=A0A8J7VZX1_9FIRM|nr:hypothetical protein [Sinanaerobacter chloroacetimidivorans]MBR0597043.1 hypothetical protein [Sinanaerobacter chloroacetimidivorans]